MKIKKLILGKNTNKPRAILFLPMLMLAVLSLVACSEKNTEENVDIFLVDDGIKIKNNTSSEIAYFAVDQEMLALLTWAPICDVDNVVSAGHSKVIEFSSILGYGPGKTVIVYYWECPRDNEDEIFVSEINTE
jgi:hypothetical protein